MRRQVGCLVGILISVAPMDAYAQPWSGLLSPSRAVEWTSAGVSGGIPNRATICTTLHPGPTATPSNTTGLVVGNHMMIDQLDDTVDGWPATGDIVVNGTTSFSGEGGNEWVRGGNRGQTQVVTVVAINGLNVTIDPPVALPNYRASQSPGAWWGHATAKGSGIEHVTVDDTGNDGSSDAGVQLHNTLNCRIKGARVVSNAQ